MPMLESIVHRPLVRTTRWAVLAVLLVTLVGCDQGMKFYAVQNWKGAGRMSYLGDLFRIEYAENKGAFLSLAATLPAEARFWVLTVGNGVLLAGLLLYLIGPRRQHALTFVALSLVLVGGVGNMIDRIRIQAVIDFFNLGIGDLRTGIFNVADMAITAGFLLLIPLFFFGERHPEEPDGLTPTPEAS